MNSTEVHQLLELNKNERGISNWNKLTPKSNKLKSYGIGLTQLRKIAKKVGRNHELSLELWQSNYYDAKIISLLIDDPKLITQEQVETQVEQLEGGHLAHVFSSCDATLAKTSFTKEIADKWISSDDAMRQQCGYGLLYEISKSKKKSAPDTAYFDINIQKIEETFENRSMAVKMAMAGALLGIGKRNLDLNRAALRVARKMGLLHFDPTGKCDPFDLEKNLTSDHVKKKLGIL